MNTKEAVFISHMGEPTASLIVHRGVHVLVYDLPRDREVSTPTASLTPHIGVHAPTYTVGRERGGPV